MWRPIEKIFFRYFHWYFYLFNQCIYFWIYLNCFIIIVFYFPLVSIPITLPLILQQNVYPIGSDWLWLLGIGVFTQLGQMLITKGLTILPAGFAGSINYSQVIFASIWGVIFFSEPLTIYIAIGAICVLGATLISISDLPNFF